MRRNKRDRLLYRRKHVNWELIGFVLALGLPFLGLLAAPFGDDAYYLGDRIMKLQIFGAVVPAFYRWNKTWIVMCIGAVMWKLLFTWSEAVQYFLDGTINPDYVITTILFSFVDLAIGAFVSFALAAIFRFMSRNL